jgi:outer membrane murein-binding lipoprotein Lpp
VFEKIKNFFIALGVILGGIVLFLLGRNGNNSKKRTDELNRRLEDSRRELGQVEQELGGVRDKNNQLSERIEKHKESDGRKLKELSNQIGSDQQGTSSRIDKLSDDLERAKQDNRNAREENTKTKQRLRKTRERLEQRIKDDQS